MQELDSALLHYMACNRDKIPCKTKSKASLSPSIAKKPNPFVNLNGKLLNHLGILDHSDYNKEFTRKYLLVVINQLIGSNDKQNRASRSYLDTLEIVGFIYLSHKGHTMTEDRFKFRSLFGEELKAKEEKKKSIANAKSKEELKKEEELIDAVFDSWK